MYSVTSVEDLQELNPFIIIGCGGGGEKFSNFTGIESVGFIDDSKKKQIYEKYSNRTDVDEKREKWYGRMLGAFFCFSHVFIGIAMLVNR